MEKIKVAVIGVGNMGKYHVKNYCEIDTVSLVAVSDLNTELGSKIAATSNCKFYADYKVMLQKEKIDLVSIAVPTIFHKDVALHCMKNKVHTLIEKPIADTLEHAQEIIRASKDYEVHCMVGHIERFNPAVQKLKELINENKFGIVNSIIIRRVGGFPAQIKDADVVIDLAVHDIDVVDFLLGKEPDHIFANGGKSLITDRNDYADIMMLYGSTTVHLQVNWITPVKIRKLTITGERGYGELDYVSQEINLYENNVSKDLDNFGDFVIYSKPRKLDVQVNKQQPLKLEIYNMLDFIRGKCKPIVTLDDAYNSLKYAIQIQKMLRKS